MNKEVEIQVKIKNPAEAEKKIRKIAKFLYSKRQIDHYFNPPHKNYTETIRIREEKGKNTFEYHWMIFDKNNPYDLISTYEYTVKIDKPSDLKEILEKIGFKEVAIVNKKRKFFDAKNFIITLDKIEKLGDFLEIEAKKITRNIENTKKLCHKMLIDLGIKYEFNAREAGYAKMAYHKLKSKNDR